MLQGLHLVLSDYLFCRQFAVIVLLHQFRLAFWCYILCLRSVMYLFLHPNPVFSRYSPVLRFYLSQVTPFMSCYYVILYYIYDKNIKYYDENFHSYLNFARTSGGMPAPK